MTDYVKRLRNSREWLNNGECCGDKDSEGICAAPACIFGEAVKELQLAASRIEKLEAALRDLSDGWECCPVSQAMRRVARDALEGKDD